MSSALVISKQGDGVPIALKLAEEGCITKIYIQQAFAKQSLRGYKNPQQTPGLSMLEQYDLILFDMVGMGKKADQLKSKGRAVIGGGRLNDKLELDRVYAERVIQQLCPGIKTLGGSKIGSVRQLQQLLQEGRPLTVKPLDNKATSLTLVSKDPENRTLKGLVQAYGKSLTPCLVQNTVMNGVEISTEGWFDGDRFSPGMFNHTIEHKRLMTGDHGPQTGCMGNTVWMTSRKDELVQRGLKPLEPLLRKANYCGPLDVNCICTEKEVYFLEFTTRFGYDAIQALTELCRQSLFDTLWKLSVKDSGSAKFWSDYSISVRLSMPPYPSEGDFHLLQGVQVIDPPKEAKGHVHLADVQLIEGTPVLAGVDGVIGCLTARGRTLREAQKRVYRTIKNTVLSDDIQYRQDIGHGVEQKIEQLKIWGWIS